MRVSVVAIVLVLLIGSGAAGGAMRVIDSRHYRIHSDLDPDLTQDLAARMDAMYDEYARRLADFAPRGEVRRLEARLFERQADYAAFTGNQNPNSSGLFMPGLNALAVYLQGAGRTEMRKTLQHEAFHQFAFNRIHPDMPIWLNEGLAEVFSEGIWTSGGFMIGEVSLAREQLLKLSMDHRRLVDFQTMLTMTPQGWNDRMADPDAGRVQYVQAWAMAHMLIFATEGTGEPYYRPYLIDMLRRIRKGQNGSAAFRDAFGGNVKGFQDRFVAYARSLRPTEAAIYASRLEDMARVMVIARTLGRTYTTMDQFRPDVEPSAFQLTDGTPMGARHVCFARNPVFHVPDIVCTPRPGLTLRARFFRNTQGRLDYELLFD